MTAELARKNRTVRDGAVSEVPPQGAEQLQGLAVNSTVVEQDDALSDARGRVSQVEDARLAKLIDVWPALGDDVKAVILSLAGQRPDDVDDGSDVNAGVGSIRCG